MQDARRPVSHSSLESLCNSRVAKTYIYRHVGFWHQHVNIWGWWDCQVVFVVVFLLTGNSCVLTPRSRHKVLNQNRIKIPQMNCSTQLLNWLFSLFFSLRSTSAAKQNPTHSNLPKSTLQRQQRQCVFVCHPHSSPTAWGQDDKRQAGMGPSAPDCHNPACFHVVGIRSGAGHCYRFNNGSDYKTQTHSCSLDWWGRLSSPAASSIFERNARTGFVTIICWASCSPFKRRRATEASSWSRWNVHSGAARCD